MTGNRGNIELSIIIDAPRARVWKILTEPEHVPEWLGCMRYEKSLGHVFYMQQDAEKRQAGDVEGATHCRILALDEPERFSFSWYVPGSPETEVEILLTDRGETTDVTFRHTGFDRFDDDAIRQIRDALAGGWSTFVLPNLKRVAESES